MSHRHPHQVQHFARPQREPTHEEIAREAYFLWEKCGRTDGNDLADWFIAERMLRNNTWWRP